MRSSIPKLRAAGVPWLRFRRAPLAYLTEAAHRGPIVDLGLGPVSYVGVFGPDETEAVLTAPRDIIDEMPPGHDRFARWFGTGVANAGGAVHRRHRTAVMRAFATRYLPIYQQQIHGAIAHFLDQLDLERPIDLVSVLPQLYQQLTIQLLFGRDPNGRLQRAVDTTVAVGRSTVDSILAPLLPWNLAGVVHGRDYRSALAEIDSAIDRLDREDTPGLGKILLAVAQPDLDRRELRDNLLQLFLAGADTVSCAMMWTLYAIASHPGVLDRLRAELGDRSDDFSQLPFLDAVIKESLRLYPTSPFGVRYVLAPVVVGGHELPRGTALIYSPWVTHRLAALYPDPERFDPDRFMHAEPPSRGAYVPFALGPHSCVGALLAHLELKTLVGLALQRFHIDLLDGQRITARSSWHGSQRPTRPTPAIWVWLRRR